MQAAVQREVCASSDTRFSASKPRDNRSYLCGFSESPYRNALDDRIQYFGTDRTNHIGADVPGGYRIHRDALCCDFLGKRHREAMNARLGSRVIGLAELPFLSVHGRDVDYPTPLLADHPLNNLFGHIEEARE